MCYSGLGRIRSNRYLILIPEDEESEERMEMESGDDVCIVRAEKTIVDSIDISCLRMMRQRMRF